MVQSVGRVVVLHVVFGLLRVLKRSVLGRVEKTSSQPPKKNVFECSEYSVCLRCRKKKEKITVGK